ncbi:MAG TPA: hypothetical protein VHK91_14510 [Flavisolibacter sp.]|jgi:chromosome segregation ATPase|nr:hypothetical protein [Flavisolibacter sp.]
MHVLSIQLSLIEISALLGGAGILGLAIYFFITSQRSLKQTLQKEHPKLYAGTLGKNDGKPSTLINSIEQLKNRIKATNHKVAKLEEPELLPVGKAKMMKEESVDHLKTTIVKQQRLLVGLLKEEEEESEHSDELYFQNKQLKNDIKKLEVQLSKKTAELDEVKQQVAITERMTSKIEEVYQEFEHLQLKMSMLEKQASRANNLALELEDTREAYEQVHKDLQRKQQKLEEALTENQQYQQELNLLEDKLAEANLQRQQLQKKVQFLQELNSDFQSMSDTNKKMQTELRRIGELESMLHMISEERDYLLKKQVNK